MRNFATLITLLTSFALVAACSPKKNKSESKPQPRAATQPSSMGAPSTPLPVAPTAPSSTTTTPAMTPAPSALPNSRTVMAADPKGKALTLIEKACTDMGSYTNRGGTGNRTFEVVCRNNENSLWHRMCYSGFPKTSPVDDDISSRSQVTSHPVTAYFHSHMIVGGVKVKVGELHCFKVPTELVGKAPRKRLKRRRYRRSRSSRSSGRSSVANRGDSSGRSSSGSGPSAYDREQDKRIKRNTDRHDTNDQRWASRDKWAKDANTLLNSLKKK